MSDRAGIYVHVPFCARVCPYCDFAVEKDRGGGREAWLRALLAEISATPEEPGLVDTIYLGGGTPSLLGAEALARILFAIAARWRLHPDTWISLEANPEDVTPQAAREWAGLGVRTLSLGAQSLHDQELSFLGRRHRAGEVAGAMDAARAAGFPIVSLDLIFGLPGQTRERWSAALDAAIALAPEHVSCYQLTIHEGTRFGDRRQAGRLRELDEETQARFYALAHERLGVAGYEGYEVSNFARGPACRSRHNSKYWRHVPYLGLGPSAHSYLDRRRWWNERDRAAWQAHLEAGELPRAGEESLDGPTLALEKVLLGLRTRGGIDLKAVARDTGVDLEPANTDRFARWAREGLVVRAGSVLRPTTAGMAVAEGLARDVEVPAPAAAALPGAAPPLPRGGA